MTTLSAVSPPTVTSHQALAIAEADAKTVYKDFSVYRIELWLDEAGWHIEYRIRFPRMAGGGPHYLIDPATGAIVSKKYYQ